MSNIANLIYQTMANRPDPAKSFIQGANAGMNRSLVNEQLQTSQAAREKQSALQNLIAQNPGITPEQLFSGGYTDEAKALANIQGRNKPETNITTNVDMKGQETYDKEAAKELVQWGIGGGFADANKSLTQLGDTLKNLKAGKVDTGWYQRYIPEGLKEAANPELVALRQNVEEVTQRNLRLVLGAQFTEKEGERLIARAFNENLPTEVNVQRVERLMGQINAAAKAKQEAFNYFQKNGTMAGFTGRQYTIADFDPDKLYGKEKKAKPSSELSIEELVNQYAPE